MYKNVIGDCPKQCDVGVLDFIDDYRKDLVVVLTYNQPPDVM